MAAFAAGLALAVVLAAGLTAGLTVGLRSCALGASPNTVLSGQILKTGHFWQPVTRAMGQIVMQ